MSWKLTREYALDRKVWAPRELVRFPSGHLLLHVYSL